MLEGTTPFLRAMSRLGTFHGQQAGLTLAQTASRLDELEFSNCSGFDSLSSSDNDRYGSRTPPSLGAEVSHPSSQTAGRTRPQTRQDDHKQQGRPSVAGPSPAPRRK